MASAASNSNLPPHPHPHSHSGTTGSGTRQRQSKQKTATGLSGMSSESWDQYEEAECLGVVFTEGDEHRAG